MSDPAKNRYGAYACNCLAIRWAEAEQAAQELAQNGSHPTPKAIRLKFNADAAIPACNKVCTPDLLSVARDVCPKHCTGCATKSSSLD